MYYDDIFKNLDNRPSKFRLEFKTNEFDFLEHIFPDSAHIDALLGYREVTRPVSFLHLMCQLRRVVSHVHKKSYSCEILIDIVGVSLSKKLDAVENWNEILLSQVLDVVQDYQFEAFETVLERQTWVFVRLLKGGLACLADVDKNEFPTLVFDRVTA